MAEPQFKTTPFRHDDAVAERTGRRILTVDVDRVVPKPQVRKVFNRIDELASSLLTDGQQTPIIVSPMNRSGQYVIQKGERRWRACKHANIPTIEVIVNHANQDWLDEVAGQLVENIQRERLSALEIATALKQFSDQRWSQSAIAARIGKSQKYVSMHLSLLNLPECALQLYERNVCTDADSLSLLRQLYEADPVRCRQVCAEALSQGLSRRRCRDIIRRARLPGPAAERSDPSAHAEQPETRNAASIVIEVVVRRSRAKMKGVLLTDRVSTLSNYACVRLNHPDGRREIVCVPSSTIEITGVRAQG